MKKTNNQSQQYSKRKLATEKSGLRQGVGTADILNN